MNNNKLKNSILLLIILLIIIFLVTICSYIFIPKEEIKTPSVIKTGIEEKQIETNVSSNLDSVINQLASASSNILYPSTTLTPVAETNSWKTYSETTGKMSFSFKYPPEWNGLIPKPACTVVGWTNTDDDKRLISKLSLTDGCKTPTPNSCNCIIGYDKTKKASIFSYDPNKKYGILSTRASKSLTLCINDFTKSHQQMYLEQLPLMQNSYNKFMASSKNNPYMDPEYQNGVRWKIDSGKIASGQEYIITYLSWGAKDYSHSFLTASFFEADKFAFKDYFSLDYFDDNDIELFKKMVKTIEYIPYNDVNKCF